MRIVVTGGSGNIGSAVVRLLVQLGHDVLTVDRRHPVRPLPGRFLFADLRRRDVFEPHLAEFAPDACCHLGEIPNVFQGNEEDVYANNATSTGAIFQSLADLGVKRIAYASSCQVYAQFGTMPPRTVPERPPGALPMDENEPVRPNNGYGAQKAGAEAYLSGLAHRHGITAAALRIPGCNDFRRTHWIKGAFRPDGRGDGINELESWLDVADAATAFAACVCWEGDAPWTGFEAFNVASDEVWHRPDSSPVAERVARARPEYPPLPSDFPPTRALLSSEKLRRTLEWTSKVTMRDLWKAAGVDAQAV